MNGESDPVAVDLTLDGGLANSATSGGETSEAGAAPGLATTPSVDLSTTTQSRATQSRPRSLTVVGKGKERGRRRFHTSIDPFVSVDSVISPVHLSHIVHSTQNSICAFAAPVDSGHRERDRSLI